MGNDRSTRPRPALRALRRPGSQKHRDRIAVLETRVTALESSKSQQPKANCQQLLRLSSAFSDPTPERGGRSKRIYRLEADGRRVLDESATTARRIYEAVELSWRTGFGCPYLVRTIDSQPPQLVRIDPMSRCRRRQPRLGIDRFQAHLPHQSTHSFRIDSATLLFEPIGHPPHTIERCPCVLLVQQPHQLEVLGALAHRPVVES